MLIIIDDVPLSKNDYVNMHWSKRAKYKKRIAWLIYNQKMREHGFKYAGEGLPYAKAKITFDIFFKTKRKRDVANYIGGGLISWLDVLVDLHFIKDDSHDCIGQPIVTFNIDKDCERTEIRIEGDS